MPYIPVSSLEVAPLGFQPWPLNKLPENYFCKSSGQPSARQASLMSAHLTQRQKSVRVQRKEEDTGGKQGLWHFNLFKIKFVFEEERALVLTAGSGQSPKC